MSGAAAGDGSAAAAPEAPVPPPQRRFLYVADPMCSWCWGFAPVIDEIARRYGDRAPVRIVLGGLRLGTRAPMSAAMKAAVRGHWEQVRATTGQPFDFAFFDRDGFVYDTEPACRAVVAVRTLLPGAALAYFTRVQRAFYVEGRDVTRVDVLADLAAEVGAERQDFLAVYAAEEIGQSLAADLDGVASLAIAGFPALVVQDAAGFAFLTIGYRSFAALEPLISRWLAAG